MTTPTPLPPSAGLHAEVDTRLVQALENFFQRSRPAICDGILRARASESSASMLIASQACTDWLAMQPDRLSGAFAAHYRAYLAQGPGMPPIIHATPQTGELQLLDDATFDRQLAVDKSGRRLVDALFPEMQPFLARMCGLLDRRYGEVLVHYSPLSVVRALSDALDALELEEKSGTLLLLQSMLPLQDTLRHTYASLGQFLESRGVAPRESTPLRPAASRTESICTAGSEVLAHIHRAAESGQFPASHQADAQRGHGQPTRPAGMQAGVPSNFTPNPGAPLPAGSFQESLDHWQIAPPHAPVDAAGAPMLVLRQFQVHAQTTDAAQFDLAMLDAVASLFEII
ncbi:MAG: DUF1631 domain-containing protein, partial [Thiobacillus sp.]|nr:DUF1631 domain-containing protein [Thiobacillus sp.]